MNQNVAREQVPTNPLGEAGVIDRGSNDRGTLALLGLFSICFLVAAVRVASRKHLWMDEVLAVWVARLPNTAAIWSALYHGAEFSPPTFHLLLHFLGRVAGFSYLVFRLPSILAAFVAGLCVFALLRQYLGVPAAAFGMTFALLGVLSGYALEARPYALVVACFALAMLLWNSLDNSRFYFPRVCGIALLLIAAICLHFYAVLLIACFAMMEFFWSLVNRRLRIAVWAGMIAAGASLVAWLPLIRAIGRYNSGDTASANYYARPSIGALSQTYTSFFIFGKKQILFLLATVFLLGLYYGIEKAGFFKRYASNGRLGSKPAINLYIIALSTAIFPILVFVFALLLTGTFNQRYCLISVLGFACLVACVFDRASALSFVTAPILLVACAITFIGSSQTGFEPSSQAGYPTYGEGGTNLLGLLSSAPQSGPIVIGEGLQYFQLDEAAPELLKSRLVYVTLPPGVTSSDPTNENQVKRWIAIRPDLKIFDADTFFAQHPHFCILHTGFSTDVLSDWLLSKGLLEKPLGHSSDAWLFQANAPE